MLIFVYGDDTFRVHEKVRQLRDAFREKHDPTGMNTSEYPGAAAKLDISQALQDACSYPFLGAKRMVVIRGAIESAKAADRESWVNGLGRIPESTIVVAWETMSPKKLEKNALFKKFSDSAQVHAYPFPVLEGRAVNAWIRKRAAAQGTAIDRQAVDELAARVGADLWQADNELKKLAAYAREEPVTKETVELLVRASYEGEIFALMDAVSQRDPERALARLREERASGANDFQLFSMLARQVRILLSARDVLDRNPSATKQDVAAELGVHPFVAQKALAQARRFASDELERAHALLAGYDLEMKSGGIDAAAAVDLVTTGLVTEKHPD